MNIEIYYRPTCPYSVKALEYLDKKKLKYTKYDITDRPDLRREMITRSNNFTVPQAFINDIYVGGSTELLALDDKIWKKLTKKN